jgi:hypothetical protein
MLLQCQGLFSGQFMMQVLPSNKSIVFTMMAYNPNLEYISLVFRKLTQMLYSQCILTVVTMFLVTFYYCYDNESIEEVLCPICIRESCICTQYGKPLHEIGIVAHNSKVDPSFLFCSRIF